MIGEAIRASGVTSIESGGQGGREVDCIVWSEDLSPWVGNPLAIAVKQHIRNASDIQAAVGRLMQAMARGSIPWGLFIYDTSVLDVGTMILVPNILTISARELFERLRTTRFGEVVRQLRNQRVHGGT